MAYSWHYYLMAGMYVVAGFAHWIFPRVYGRILPPWIPFKRFTVWGSGVLEAGLGIALLFPHAKDPALYAIMAMLVLFLPVHIHMLRDKRAAGGLPGWLLWLRLPLQAGLVYWAYVYLG
ncbi:MauE/DoxX family redox-associated membrane protein [Robiginitalea sp. SC105]|uniref:DoxX family protein n=1 Tax=Robiginitalea sp. SC105 TaxID=2762332 RepID=UPI00163ACA72|nr:MauE/DoxX family redox-associated membrane protein [Robiginitalea sp. SC105]MBC2839172.1 hypothetical protein [Robiginitalea sp. SC105]